MGTVVGVWRLKLILILVVIVSLVYSANAMFGNAEIFGTVDENGYIINANPTSGTGNTSRVWDETTGTYIEVGYNQSDVGLEKSTGFTDVLFGIGEFLTFAIIDNVWARLFLGLVMSLIFITIGYLIFTFIKEWIPLV